MLPPGCPLTIAGRSFASIINWGEVVVGEVYVGMKLVSSFDTEVTVELPIQEISYQGKLGRIQTLLRNRQDPVARAFAKLYPDNGNEPKLPA